MYMYTNNELQTLIGQRIIELEYGGRPDELYSPIRYMMRLGGKRVRPVLTLMTADLYGVPVEKAMNAALCMEIFHNFTLIHDDLMDKADMRRNHPTVHKLWDENISILSGDAMLITAYKMLCRPPVVHLRETIDLFTRTALEICEGQIYDMSFEKKTDVSEENYLEMIRLKTAVLIGCCMKSGAIAAGAPAKDAGRLYRFGVNIGMAYQLRDDILDVYGSPDVFGKKTGGDILSDKKTFPLVYALTHGTEGQKNELKQWLVCHDFIPKEKIAAFTRIYDAVGIKEVADERISTYYVQAKNLLSELTVAGERTVVLEAAVDDLLQRNA
jgi:geranylgeranyl diphosphate synthase type II